MLKYGLLLSISLLFLTSCGDDDKPTFVGNWTLRQYDGQSLPTLYNVFDATHHIYITSATLTLASDKSFILQENFETRDPSQGGAVTATNSSTAAKGNYSISGSVLSFTQCCGFNFVPFDGQFDSTDGTLSFVFTLDGKLHVYKQ